jgi:hypothetical protein
MFITCKNDNNIIVYALEMIISYAKKNQYIFAAQCIWWLPTLIGLEQGLITRFDSLRFWTGASNAPSSVPVGVNDLHREGGLYIGSGESCSSESDKQD